jgi:S-formylglutathione hydrolase
MTDLTRRSEHRCHGGEQGFYAHRSVACAGPMRLSVFLPHGADEGGPVPAIYALAGLTCTEETLAIKAGAQEISAALGLALVTRDTSPRAVRFPGDDASWDSGLGAADYVSTPPRPPGPRPTGWRAALPEGGRFPSPVPLCSSSLRCGRGPL